MLKNFLWILAIWALLFQILLFQKEIILHNLYTLWKNMQAQSQ